MIKKILRSLLFFSLGFLVLYLVYDGQRKNFLANCAAKGISEEHCDFFQKLIHDFASSNWFYVFLTMVFFFISNYFRALRWNLLLQPLDIHPKTFNSLSAVMIGYLANLAIPRAGEVARASVLSKYEKVPFDKTFGTVILDRLLDGVTMIFLTLVTFIFAYDKIYLYFDQHLNLSERLSVFKNNYSLLAILSLVITVTIYLAYKYYNNIINHKIGSKIVSILSGMKEGIMSIFKQKNPFLLIAYSFVVWLMYYLMVYTLFHAYGPTSNLGAVAALITFFFGTLGVIFPSPGGMGSYHFLTVEALSLYKLDSADAFSYANMAFFTFQIVTTILFGILAIVILAIKNKKD